jgi:hypothetical protein
VSGRGTVRDGPFEFELSVCLSVEDCCGFWSRVEESQGHLLTG